MVSTGVTGSLLKQGVCRKEAISKCAGIVKKRQRMMEHLHVICISIDTLAGIRDTVSSGDAKVT
jgi:hypothetical protein